MLDLNLTQSMPLPNNAALDVREEDARLDRAVNALMIVMAFENTDLFEGVDQVTPGFDELENELAALQTDELRGAYERVLDAEVAFDATLTAIEAEARTEIENARGQVESIEREIAQLRAQVETLEKEFEPQYRVLADEMEAENRRATELRAKAAGLNDEARAQFENKIELVLKARLRPFEERYAAIDAERTARRQPLEQQITEWESQKRDCEEQFERVLKGQGEMQNRATAIREGRAGEGAALYVSLRDLLAKREKFVEHVAGVEKSLSENARMNAVAKRHARFVEQARLELDAPINAAGALTRAQEGQIEDAKRMLEIALRGGLDKNKANEIRKAITQAEYHVLVKEWEHEIVRRAPQLNGMNAVNRYKEHIADKSREAGYERLSRDLARAIAHAEKLAGQGVAARRRMLEVHAAQYISSQNKFFSAQVMPDSGRMMIAVKKNGVWLRHALCLMVETNGDYEIKTTYYERKTALDDQVEWDTRRARLEKRLSQVLMEEDGDTGK